MRKNSSTIGVVFHDGDLRRVLYFANRFGIGLRPFVRAAVLYCLERGLFSEEHLDEIRSKTLPRGVTAVRLATKNQPDASSHESTAA